MSQPEAHITPPSPYPIFGSIALFCIVWGVIGWLHTGQTAHLSFIGLALLILTIFIWFRRAIRDSLGGLRENKIVAKSYRLSMIWFIFSEVMFFATFFGTLYYVRAITLPHLAGDYDTYTTHYLLWPGFENVWPLLTTPNPSVFKGPDGVMATWDIPAINTAILLLSGVTITFAHWAILKAKRLQAAYWQAATAALGILFLTLQVKEYIEAYTEKGLTLGSGIFGSTFFMLTGFHGLHVTLGTIMLICIFFRILKNEMTPTHHFAFEAVAWYWHFVDVVWLILFVFVYWL